MRIAWRVDLVGQVFSRLTVISEQPGRPQPSGQKPRLWLCRCECGKETVVRTGSLRSGMTRSCGCLHSDTTKRRNHKHGLARKVPEYTIWKNMRKRCQNPNTQDAKYYAGRGIKVCARWADFAAFYADMGPRPTPRHSIDRIDVNGDYGPDNCRWATPVEQRRNRRDYIAQHGAAA